MASLVNIKGKWRAQVRRTGYPSCAKTFPTKEEALEWAERIEKDLRDATSAAEPLSTTFSIEAALKNARNKPFTDIGDVVLRGVGDPDPSTFLPSTTPRGVLIPGGSRTEIGLNRTLTEREICAMSEPDACIVGVYFFDSQG